MSRGCPAVSRDDDDDDDHDDDDDDADADADDFLIDPLLSMSGIGKLRALKSGRGDIEQHADLFIGREEGESLFKHVRCQGHCTASSSGLREGG